MKRLFILSMAVLLTAGCLWAKDDEVIVTRQLTTGQRNSLPEKTITQQMRQDAFDNWENTDDHGMQIFGIAHDQNGKKYYMVKNSWGTARSDYKGIWYVSEAFMKYKTNDVLVHKNAIPKDIRAKLGF